MKKMILAAALSACAMVPGYANAASFTYQYTSTSDPDASFSFSLDPASAIPGGGKGGGIFHFDSVGFQTGSAISAETVTFFDLASGGGLLAGGQRLSAFLAYSSDAGTADNPMTPTLLTGTFLATQDDGGVGSLVVTSDAVAGVPEPATWGMMVLGFGAMGYAARRRAKVRTTVAFG